MDKKQLAQTILTKVGGKENVRNVIHCATRLRFTLVDEDKAQTEEIKQLAGVMTVVRSGGQYQVVVGDTVSEVHAEILKLAGLENEQAVQDDGPKGSIGARLVAILSGLFTPVMGLLAGAGILKGLLVLLVTVGWLKETNGTYTVLYAAADAFFYFLPILLGFSAGKVFKANQYISATIGAVLVYPTLVALVTNKEALTFLKIPVVLMNYTSSLIPIVVAVFVLSKLEILLKKWIPDALKLIFIPLLSLVIMVPLTLLVVGPISSGLSTLLADISMAIYSFSPILAGFVLAGIWQVAVLFGLHWAFIPIFINNIAVQGYDPINAMLYCTVFAQTGAALAVALKARTAESKSLAYSATLSGFLGITEPIIYGVTLPRKKPFIAASIGSAFGGALAGAFQAKMFGGFASGGVFGIPMFIDPKGINSSFLAFVGSLVVAFTIALVLTFVLDRAKEEPVVAAEGAEAPVSNEGGSSAVAEDEQIGSPLAGKVTALSASEDAVFASGAMGQGIVIQPTLGTVVAPADGVVTTLFPTGHAIGIVTDHGAEILIHIGMDTVSLKGEGFTLHVIQNQRVKKGDLLVTADLAAIQAAGLSIGTPVVVTNSERYATIEPVAILEVDQGADLLTLIANK